MVPIDDTNTLVIGWRYFSDDLDPQGLGDRSKVGRQSIDFIGQTEEERSYEERQRQPGDYEVLVSQRRIAVHALETLASSDQGVAMLRRMLRKNIRALAEGTAPVPVPAGPDGLLATYVQDTVIPAPPASEAKLERERLARVGKRVADLVLASGQQPAAERRDWIDTQLTSAPPEA
jgi:hypothetical protein